jgi:3-hydroxybutyryl-CoA dehydrogenase
MQIGDVRRVLIVGAGTMGQQIGLQCATHGYEVVLHDIDPSALERALERVRGYADELVATGALGPGERAAALEAIAATTDMTEAAEGADLVSESVPEDPELKARVFAELDRVCPERTVFTTNASTLVPSMFAAATGRPDRFAALHFHQPVWSSNVVDVMPHADTSVDTIELLVAFARLIGQVPIRLEKEHGGYVLNAMLNAVNREALTLAANGVVAFEDVDRAWMGVMKMPLGPFGIMDVVGLDTVWDITDLWARALGDAQLRANADFVEPYVGRGELGVKTGRGFYTYPDPAYQRPGFIEGRA